MFKIVKDSIRTGIVTSRFPATVELPPDGFRGKPVINFARCTACDKCAEACPTGAIAITPEGARRHLSIAYGDCIFCGECESACPDAVTLTNDFQLAVTEKDMLKVSAYFAQGTDGKYSFFGTSTTTPLKPTGLDTVGREVKEKIHELFGRSLQIREVDAGSCNGCEVELTALTNPIYDIERFGIHFVASPRHADMLLVTGPVTRNLQRALLKTYEATPDPKLVVAVGACAIGGGIFGKSYASYGGADSVVPVDAFIPGCPPRPEAVLHGILVALGRYQTSGAESRTSSMMPPPTTSSPS
jgi:Ni,Fe-hydrogenase III small subunit/formate hydrogenlyase subunit 6/NADH:ubiquinone oxidoreductase subunit I